MPGDFKGRHFRSGIILRAVRWYCQAALWQYRDGVSGEVRLVERAFGTEPSGISEAIQKFEAQLIRVAA